MERFSWAIVRAIVERFSWAADRASFQAPLLSQLDASLRSCLRPGRTAPRNSNTILQQQFPPPCLLCVFASLRETPSAQVSKHLNYRYLTPRCARVCGPGGPHHVKAPRDRPALCTFENPLLRFLELDSAQALCWHADRHTDTIWPFHRMT